MKIYTKKGDSGETGLYGGERVSKDNQRIHTYVTLDELNAVLGLLRARDSEELPVVLSERLYRLQNELFQVGSELATPRGKTTTMALIGEGPITKMETEIDSMESELSPLQAFILPGGTKTSALLHFARTVSRRAERELITLNRAEPVRAELLRYLNRLSDYLFVCARYANLKSKVKDVPWVAPKA